MASETSADTLSPILRSHSDAKNPTKSVDLVGFFIVKGSGHAEFRFHKSHVVSQSLDVSFVRGDETVLNPVQALVHAVEAGLHSIDSCIDARLNTGEGVAHYPTNLGELLFEVCM